MEYVKRLPEPPAPDQHRFVVGEPFHFEPCSGMLPPLAGLAPLAQCDETDLPVAQTSRRPNRISQESSGNSDDLTFGSTGHGGQRGSKDALGPMMAWTSSMGTIEPSDTESVESGKSSPTNAGSPMIPNNNNRKSTDSGGEHQHQVRSVQSKVRLDEIKSASLLIVFCFSCFEKSKLISQKVHFFNF
jgi:hypothetical protein